MVYIMAFHCIYGLTCTIMAMLDMSEAGSKILLWVETVGHHNSDDSDKPERKQKILLDHLVKREKRTVLT